MENYISEGEQLKIINAWFEAQTEMDKAILLKAAIKLQTYVREHNCQMSLQGALLVLYKIGRKWNS